MNRQALTNGQALSGEDQDLQKLFATDCPQFAPVNVTSVISAAASDNTVNRTCEGFSSLNVDQDSSIWKRRSFMLKCLGFLGACAASTALVIVFSPLGSGTAFAQVQESLKKVRTATYTVTIASDSKTPLKWQVYLSDSFVCRVEQPNGVYLVFDAAKKRLMEVIPAESKARVTEGLNVPDGFNVIAQLTRSDLKLSNEAPSNQVKNIGPVAAKGFTVKDKQARFTIWVAPNTDLPLLVEKFSAENDPGVTETWAEFQYNVPLQASLFSFEAPEGFKTEVVHAPNRGDAQQTDVQQKPSSTRRDSPNYGFGPGSK